MRNQEWQSIWSKKGVVDRGRPLHVINGYDLLTEPAWDDMIAKVAAPLQIAAHQSILEFGCGAGAFLQTLKAITPTLQLNGVDYSQSLIEVARQRLDGIFRLHDITKPHDAADGAYDVTAAFGVVNYLDDGAAVDAAISEMIRTSRRRVLIGDVNDLDKVELARAIRAKSHVNAQRVSTAVIDQQYFAKATFEATAERHGLQCTIVDHTMLGLGDYQAAQYRYSVYFDKGEP